MIGIQKASIFKRVSAFILDIILLAVLATGFAYVSSLAFDVDGHQEKLQEYYDYYEETYDVKFGLTQEEIDELKEEELKHYKEVQEILENDEELVYEYNLVINLTLVVLFIGILLSVTVLEFVFPLIFKDGQTIGKKVFSLCVVKNNSVKMTTLQLFVRTYFGKFIIELIFPTYLIVMAMFGSIGIIGPIVIGLLLIVQLILLFFTRNRTVIHDSIAYTVVCDKQTQKIFDSEQDLIRYKEDNARVEAKEKIY